MLRQTVGSPESKPQPSNHEAVGTPQTDADKRRSPRIKKVTFVHATSYYQDGSEARLSTGKTENFSEGGMRVVLGKPLPLRSVVSLSIALDDNILDVTGQVVYLQVVDSQHCAMGVEFLNLGGEAREQIRAFLEDGEESY
jgi:c-di-GMP-binding flagellar brake protein YcgR